MIVLRLWSTHETKVCAYEDQNIVDFTYGAPDLVTATFVVQKNSGAEKKTSFSYLSGKNAPFSKLIKTTRPIFI